MTGPRTHEGQLDILLYEDLKRRHEAETDPTRRATLATELATAARRPAVVQLLEYQRLERAHAAETDTTRRAALAGQRDAARAQPVVQDYLAGLVSQPASTTSGSSGSPSAQTTSTTGGTQASGGPGAPQRWRMWVPTGQAYSLLTMGKGRPGESHTGFSVLTSEHFFTRAGGNLVMQSAGWSLWESIQSAHVHSHNNVVVGANEGVTVAGRKSGVNIIAGFGRTNPLAAPSGTTDPVLTLAEDLKDQYDKKATILSASLDGLVGVAALLKGAKDLLQYCMSAQSGSRKLVLAGVGFAGLASGVVNAGFNISSIAGAGEQKASAANPTSGTSTASAVTWPGANESGSASASINLLATNGIIMATPTWVGIHGVLGVTLSSLFNLVYGLDSSVWGIASASLESLLGDVTVSGRNEATVEARKGVTVRSLKDTLTLVGKEVEIGTRTPALSALLLPPSQKATASIALASTDKVTVDTKELEVKLGGAVPLGTLWKADKDDVSVRAKKTVRLIVGDFQLEIGTAEINLSRNDIAAPECGLSVKKDDVWLGAKERAGDCGFQSTPHRTQMVLKQSTVNVTSGGISFKSNGTLKFL